MTTCLTSILVRVFPRAVDSYESRGRLAHKYGNCRGVNDKRNARCREEGRRREGACEDPKPGNSAGERRDWGGITARFICACASLSTGFPPTKPQEARSRLSKVFPGLRNERQGPPLRREPPKRTYSGLRASGEPPHSGILTAATTSARAANPLLRSPNGRSTPVKSHAPERAPPGSASFCLPLANRKSRRVDAPPLSALQLTNGDPGCSLVPPFQCVQGCVRVDHCSGGAGPVLALRMTQRLLQSVSSHHTGSHHSVALCPRGLGWLAGL